MNSPINEITVINNTMKVVGKSRLTCAVYHLGSFSFLHCDINYSDNMTNRKNCIALCIALWLANIYINETNQLHNIFDQDIAITPKESMKPEIQLVKEKADLKEFLPHNSRIMKILQK